VPKISIILPVYNAGRYLPGALGSVYAQTFKDWEMILVDDASTDDSAKILAAQDDPRLVVLRNDTNLGLTRSLLRALEVARGQFVARLDADDAAEPERLSRQVHYLQEHPHVGILGSAYTVVDEGGKVIGERLMPETPVEVRWASMLHCPFGHPTVMFRRTLLEEHGMTYDPAWEPGEDYDLWARLLAVVDGVNLPEPLVRYRSHAQSVSNSRFAKLMEHGYAIAERTIRAALPGWLVQRDTIPLMMTLSAGAPLAASDEGRRAEALGAYVDLLSAFAKTWPQARRCRALASKETGMILRQMRPLRGSVDYLRLAARLARLFPRAFLRTCYISLGAARGGA
jgi:glycosyltransferase involved in cell wall biosynthesis